MTQDISFLIGLKNNLEYTKIFYENVRKLYPGVEIVFVSFGSTDGTHRWMDSLNDPFLKYYYSEESKTLSDTYNKATEISTKKFVCFLHNDMVLGKHFLKNLSEDLSEDHVNFYKVTEPPVFTGDFRDWKLTRDFGDDIHLFDFEKFFDFENEYISNVKNSTAPTSHSSFFLCVKRDNLIEIGGLDNLFNPMFCEDDDLIIRLKFLGLETVQLNRALVYHFVSKTSRFSKEYENKTKAIEEKSQRNYIRKWGSKSGSIPLTYDVGIILNNGNVAKLSELEPFAKVIYTDFPFEDYINEEQAHTKYDLREKIRPISELKKHDVMVHVNGKALNAKTLNSISNISAIITENKKDYLNPNLFHKFYLKIIKPYRPLIFFNQPERIEKSFIHKELEI
ncbi:glycosyltransferase family 2 protein [Chryseobacterium gregarium]|uniref:glycosyltransferase family 2 protein n=1 Tax=Chryseobacterium gregarium TaxID=456299 RepID=UPI000414D6D4|nr:glycosyltransferase [Chryseobacterium gregarium]